MPTTRTLNRTTLARQLLLDRHDLRPDQAIEHLVGLQAQATASPYVALWSRLNGFTADRVGTMLEDRTAVRTTLMRGTLHLVTARDCAALRPAMQPVLDRAAKANFGRDLVGVDLAALVEAALPLLTEPRTTAQLGAALAPRWPDHQPRALGNVLPLLVPMVQVPPRGILGRGGPAANAPASTWLGVEIPASTTPDAAVLRYLAAFGPATIADISAWSRLTGVKSAITRLDLKTYRDERGRTLLDVPDGVLIDPDTPAPPRFLPEFDNVLLSHADRTRIMSEEHRKRWSGVANAVFPASFLLDGFLSGTWKTDKGTLTISPYVGLSTKDKDALVREGLALLDFLAPRHDHDVRFAD
ncbi:winged helix DNA-binding domain-containing protein [Umezawaea sp. Da 62-37]|uniref:winged helix DNA-binding domain-containing protein n=1 Tax=Umezawaea sp. Da 62-37 TaxID=3075927 RepID=UPI0028F6D813|nr:winged helix DNA-binding domain-containing protein [Umezawaea sp. Da 62-37]WNV89844.1 winged helix DNA-binding domain-containing protein [Umezawaea sp. Da 62-37]